MKNFSKLLIEILLIIVFTEISFSQENDTTMTSVYNMSLEELMNTKVNIATKIDQPLTVTPSVISVISAEDIKNMGARELEDVLQLVPGFELNRGYSGAYYNIGVRGVKDSRTISKLLIMVDGVPFNQIFYGSYMDWGYTYNLETIERIEIIRGPGSALYGRNAFSAVINIITKNGKSGPAISAKGTLGSFNNKSGSLFYGLKKNKFDVSVCASRIKTDLMDINFPNDFLESVKVNSLRNNYWVNTNINSGKFSFSGLFLNSDFTALLSKSFGGNRLFNYSLSYKNEITNKLYLDVKVFGHNANYFEDFEQLRSGVEYVIPKSLYYLLPSGMTGMDNLKFSDVWPNGIYYRPQLSEYQYGAEADLKFKLLSSDLLIGLQSDFHGVKNVMIYSNYDFSTKFAFPNITRNNKLIYEPGWFLDRAHDYNNIAFLLQDIWYPFEKLGITIGGRYDLDSEIGGVLNPRAGIVYELFRNTTIKLLYGKAYRAPSPSEQYCKLGFAIGNENLRPEIINTYEISLSYRHKNMNNTINVFRNRLTDMIYAASITYIDPNNKYYNIGENTSFGVEYENKLVLGRGLYSFFNYSYTKSENTDSINGKNTTFKHPDIAPHKLNFGINYAFLDHLNINLNMYYRSEMQRFKAGALEVQDEIGNYAIFNSSFQVNNFIKGFNMGVSVYNMFDKKYYSQDSQHLNQPPQPGRQIIASISYIIK